jgi:Trypsin
LTFTPDTAITFVLEEKGADMELARRSGRKRSVAVALLLLTLAVLSYSASSNPREGSTTLTGTASASSAVEPAIAGEVAALTRRGMAHEQAIRAIEVEGRIAQAHLLGKLESDLGKGYGGEWFSPATALLHVGVTSPSSRRRLESIADRAGLTAHVTASPVRSGWRALVVAQKRWNRRLSGLFERAEVVTSLVPQRNLLKVEVASSVPTARIATLKRHAAVAPVAVSIVPVQAPRLQLALQEGRCAEFVTHEAYCDPTLVAGVTIKPLGTGRCTAGPTVLLAEGASTNTYMLTAGHCLERWGGKGTNVWTYEKEGDKEKLIGEAVAVENNKADIAAIEVNNPGFWAQEGAIPVAPTIAQWSEEESEPVSVPGQLKPVVGWGACKQGQTTGKSCGTIAAISVMQGTREQIVEVEGATGARGDSGAPWYSTENGFLYWVLGTLVGRRTDTGRLTFQRLSFALEELRPKIDLKLLTTENETRDLTVFCSEDPGTGETESCPAGKSATHVHEATLSGKKAKLLTGFITVECDVLFLGESLAEAGTPQLIEGNFTYTNCGSCTVTETSEKALMEISKSGHETADVTYENAWFVECGGFLACEYDGEGLVGTAKGPLLATETNGEISVQGQELHKAEGGFLCPKTAKLDIVTTPLSATYITNL